MRGPQTWQPFPTRIGSRCRAFAILTSTALAAGTALAEDACHRTLAIMSDASVDPVTVEVIARSAVTPVVAPAVNVPLLGAPFLFALVLLVALSGIVLRRSAWRQRHWVVLILLSVLTLTAVGPYQVPVARSDPSMGPLDVSPSTLVFDLSTVATATATQQVIVRNRGGPAVRMTGVVVPLPFGVESDCAQLAAGATCNVSVSTTLRPGGACAALPSPTLSAIAPAEVGVQSRNTTITVKGSGFQPGAAVKLGPSSVASVRLDDGTLTLLLADAMVAMPQQVPLRVRNPDGGVSNALMLAVVPVSNKSPTVRITSPLSGSSFSLGESIGVDIAASDPDGSVTLIELLDGASKLTSVTGPFAHLDWHNASAGEHVLTARATDNQGATSVSAPVSVHVADGGQLSVAITSPADGVSLVAPASVHIAARPQSAGAPIDSVSFTANGVALGSTTTAPYKMLWSGVGAGFYALQATTRDTSGRTAASPRLGITVVDDPEEPGLSITSHSDGALIDSDTLTLSGVTRRIKTVMFAGDCRAVEFANQTFKIRNIPIGYGDNELTVIGVGDDGSRIERTIVVRATRPSLNVDAPADGSITVLPFAAIHGSLLAPEGSSVRFTRMGTTDRQVAVMSGMHFQALVPLATGVNSVVATLTTPQGTVLTRTLKITRTFGDAALAINSPLDLQSVEAHEVNVSGTFNAEQGSTVSVNGVFAALDGGVFVARIRLVPGTNVIVATLVTPDGQLAQTRVRLNNQYPQAGPIDTPAAGTVVRVGPTLVEGVVKAPDKSIVTINGLPAETVDRRLYYAAGTPSDYYLSRVRSTVAIAPGDNAITLKVVSPTGSSDAHEIHVQGATDASMPTVAITKPPSGSYIGAGQSISVTATSADNRIAQVQLLENGSLFSSIDVNAPSISTDIEYHNRPPGTYTVAARAIDQKGSINDSAPIILKRPFLPVVAITSPANQTHFSKSQPIHVSVGASVQEGTIKSITVTDNYSILRSNLQPPYEFDWTDAGVGPHPLLAIATSDAGLSVTSAGISVYVDRPANQPPTIRLDSPSTGQRFRAPVPITLAAAASDIDGQVVQVEFLDSGTVVGTVTHPPYLFVWNSAAVGDHQLTARATDDQGATTTSATVSISVSAGSSQAPAIALALPVAQELFSFAEPITLLAQVSDDDGTVGQVDFYDAATPIGSAMALPYQISWTGALPGEHKLTAKATDRAGATKTSEAVAIFVNPEPQLAVDDLVDGSTVEGDFLSIWGSVVAPRNAGIVVNGAVAVYDRNGHFFVPNVPLLPGTNTLELTLNTDDGKAVNRTITVNSSGTSPVLLEAAPWQGIGPLTTNITLALHDDVGVDHVDFDLDGTGSAVVSSPVMNGIASAEATFSHAGTYPVRAAAKDSAGRALFSATGLIYVYDEASLDSLMRNVWGRMNAALAAGDKPRALVALNKSAQEKYEPVFDALLPYMPGIIASYSPIQSVWVNAGFGEFAVNRTIDGSLRVFLLYLLQDEQGLWRMDSM